LRLSKALT